MNMTVLYKKCTYGLLLITTTLIGSGLNFSSAGSYTYTGTVSHLIPTSSSTSAGYFKYGIPVPIFDNSYENTFDINCSFSNLNVGDISFTKIRSEIYFNVNNSEQALPYNVCQASTVGLSDFSCSKTVNNNKFVSFSHLLLQFEYSRPVSSSQNISFDYSCTFEGNNIINQSDLSNSGNSSCSPEGSCTVSDKVSENILFTGSKSFNTSYTNMFNYGTEGAGTYCLKFTSSNPQTLTMGFANGPTTTPTNLYTLYNDQYGNTICLYGNKPYFNVKLNSSSNTIDYEVYKLTDLLSDDIPCEGSSESCDYSDYELKSNITENYCKNKYSSLITQGECNSTYSGYVAPNIYQICTNSLNSCSNELTTCNTTLTSCINGNFTGNVMRSALYINNVQHLSNDNIYITIPEEIERDYVNLDDETEIEITGYGYDQNAMQEMVNTQFTPPSAEDMENIIGKVADFLPLIAIMLLIVYTWWLIKKVF